jgi:hypothetical protein
MISSSWHRADKASQAEDRNVPQTHAQPSVLRHSDELGTHIEAVTTLRGQIHNFGNVDGGFGHVSGRRYERGIPSGHTTSEAPRSHCCSVFLDRRAGCATSAHNILVAVAGVRVPPLVSTAS